MTRVAAGRHTARMDVETMRRELLEYALSLPEAYLEHPWGEDVAKVRRKVFVFFGTEPFMTVKVPDSWERAMSMPGAEPAGYGLGKSGWVSIPLGARGVDVSEMRPFIDESYCHVAPKRLVARLPG